MQSSKLRIGLALALLAGFVVLACTAHTPSVTPEPLRSNVKLVTPVHVRSGLEVFLEEHDGFPGETVALMTNQSCVNHDLEHGAALLASKVDLTLLMSPEHGLYGAEDAGARIGAETDPATGIRSLTTYGLKPADIVPLLEGIDIALLDIQDIGVRSYTYIYSMAYLMQAAAESGTRVVILDRPNPVNGEVVEGNILEADFSSFVGLYPIPYRHGMTIGELALLFNSQFDIGCQLEVVELDGWSRNLMFEDTDLPWVPTSPHVPDASTILPMIATGVFGELHVLSEGVGTTIPFEFAGGPWIKNPKEYAEALAVRCGPGVQFRPTFVKPYYGRYKGQVCGGVQIYVTDPELFQPYYCGLVMLAVHQELYPEVDLYENEKRHWAFQRVTGNEWIMTELQKGTDPNELRQRWQPELDEFMAIREQYLLYD